MENYPVVIIGAGVAGLSCATYLARTGQSFLILEGSTGIGGRVRTDRYKGYLLDRGFQVFLADYPEAHKLLDYESLGLQAFRSGALIKQGNGFSEVVHPLKEPGQLFTTLISRFATLPDKLRILKLGTQILPLSDESLLQGPANQSTMAYLQQQGFSQKIIQNFFIPFFGGVYLDRDLKTSSNFFRFIFKYFATSAVTLPTEGIEAIPAQLAAKLPAGSIRTGTMVKALTPENEIILADGERLTAGTLVLATDAAAAAQLLGEEPPARLNQTTCTYFTSDESPNNSKLLMLNPNSHSVVHNVSVPSDICPSYAPAGKALISVSTHGPHGLSPENLALKIKAELKTWFGETVENWRYLKTYFIPQGLPPTAPNPAQPFLQLAANLYRCGDYTAYPSLNAAMATGRLVAENITGKKF
ncbi:oxidoreductase [Adhaeribacter aerolatus]|uniref:Oxidoreductase n=1 Tax=Adhaeribacter aerolatus TaxID=670289 RepID=A0A512AS79_9BACT|nr:NAD(P)/FAD-dependent oxidoreductase [Adhaeribacter aerolatus]GEO02568.1 oxidoreductase [Adhaeribacter aerolatus]